MASGHVNRANRPNTWLLRPLAARVKKALANPEPSTHGPQRRFAAVPQAFRSWRLTGRVEDIEKTALMTHTRHPTALRDFSVHAVASSRVEILAFALLA
jgi:hypothetical protein